MNIKRHILDVASELGLGTVETGGGCDFIIRTVGSMDLVLSGVNLESPQSLIERGVVSFYRHNGDVSMWEDSPFQTLTFYTVRQAMTFMATVKDFA